VKLVLIDADHRQTGNTTPVATVYKVFTGERRLSENSRFIRQMPDGQVLVAGSYQELFGELLKKKTRCTSGLYSMNLMKPRCCT
jgi:hypothetical protein